MNNMISVQDIPEKIIPLTYFRRNTGEVLKRLPQSGPFFITKDGQIVAQISDVPHKLSKAEIAANLKKVKELSGGYKLGKGFSPEELNKLLDDRYDEMLPRQ